MNEQLKIETVKWSAPEYLHKEHSNDWFWTIGLVAIVGCLAAIWFESYLFAIFIFISGLSLIMFAGKKPQIFEFTIDNKGLKVNKEDFAWKDIKSFNIKDLEDNEYNKLLIETTKNFIPIYTFLIPKDITDQATDEILKLIKKSEIDESRTIQFAEKVGF
jgi:hypothetical protein